MDRKSPRTKAKKGMLLIIIAIAAICAGKVLFLSFDVSDCKSLEPQFIAGDSTFRHLDMSEKKRLAFRKYGFRKKIVVDDPTVVTQYAEPYGMELSDGYFGIFRDKDLTKPVEAVDFKWMYRDADFEEGKASEIPYDEKKDGIILLLPGTYYAAVYSTNPFAAYEIAYLSLTCPYNGFCQLQEGQTEYFCIVKENQKNTFSLSLTQGESVRITTNLYVNGTVKLYEPDGTMIKVKRASEAAEQPVQVEFAARSTGIYTVEVSEIEKSREDAYDVMMYHIKYEHLES